jgi:hypothetical protein
VKGDFFMGAQGSGSSSKSSAVSHSVEKLSSLAETQESILQEREKFFQDYFVPEFKEAYSALDPDSDAGSAQMGLTAKEINTSFDAAQKQTDQSLAQRNLGNTGAGAALTAANNRARSSALANAYATSAANSADKKVASLGTLAQLMPQTTTAAPTLTETKSKSGSSSFSLGGGFQLM